MSKFDNIELPSISTPARQTRLFRTHKHKVQEWLREYPEIGKLNSGKFYIYPVDGIYTELKALQIPTSQQLGEY